MVGTVKLASVKERSKVHLFDFVNYALMAVVLIIMLYPLYFVLIASFSDPYAVSKGQISFYPIGFTFEGYQNILASRQIWIGYRNSILYTLFGTLFNLILTIPSAYVLSKRTLPGRKFFNWFFLFTMYFSGGLIPTYLLIRDLELIDTPWVLIVLGGVSVYNLIVARVYFSANIPEEIYEAAKIDGASDFTMFFRIALPLSAPIIAILSLYYGVGRWNSYFDALMYTSSIVLQPLQIILRNILILNETSLLTIDVMSDAQIELAARRAYMAQSMKYSLVFISSAPLLIAYPFIQKHFVKGVMIGSLKG